MQQTRSYSLPWILAENAILHGMAMAEGNPDRDPIEKAAWHHYAATELAAGFLRDEKLTGNGIEILGIRIDPADRSFVATVGPSRAPTDLRKRHNETLGTAIIANPGFRRILSRGK